MDEVARMRARDRADLFSASAQARSLNATIIEKDFWVCWTLKRLFSLPNLPAGLIFKGGTSLSKVFGAIERFSEDVDLSFNRADLGFTGDKDPVEASSKKRQQAQVDYLVETASLMIRDTIMPKLNAAFEEALQTPAGVTWRLELADDDQQAILFHYPQAASPRTRDELAYLRPNVRLEMGARGEHWPVVDRTVRPYAADDLPQLFKEPDCTVRAAAAERTFWEKATILHMWFNAPASRRLSDRQSRHYYDVVKLFEHGLGKEALKNPDLLRAVAKHKSVFFARAWAKFEEAVPGSLRLVPPQSRIAELEQDYAKMREEMIFGDAPSLEHILDVIAEIEKAVNGNAAATEN